MSQDAYKKAMEELDALEKSLTKEETNEDIATDLDAIQKSLEEEVLAKSDDEGEGDEGEEETEKSMSNDEYADELVKASEAYASLEKSLNQKIDSLTARLDAILDSVDTMRKSQAAHMNLGIKEAKVLATLSKSMDDFGRQPTAPNKAVLGIGNAEGVLKEELSKSVAEVRELLIKSVSEEKVDPKWLGVYDRFKDVNVFDDETKTALGL